MASEAGTAPRPGINTGLVSLAMAMWGVLFFTTLFSIGFFLSDPDFWLGFVARYWLASASLSGITTYIVAKMLAEYYASSIRLAEEYMPSLQPRCKEPRVYDAAARVAQAVAGLQQLSSLWALSAASLGLLGLYNGVLLYYLVRLGAKGLQELGYRVSGDIPSTRHIAALGVASLGLGLVAAAYYTAVLLREIEASTKSLVEEAEATWMPSVD